MKQLTQRSRRANPLGFELFRRYDRFGQDLFDVSQYLLAIATPFENETSLTTLGSSETCSV